MRTPKRASGRWFDPGHQLEHRHTPRGRGTCAVCRATFPRLSDLRNYPNDFAVGGSRKIEPDLAAQAAYEWSAA